MGLIGAQTPFVTGTPFTLLNSTGELQPGGVVGYALKFNSPFKLIQKHHGLKSIGKSFLISRCRGNIVLEINDSTATKELLDLLNSDTGQSPHDIFASILPSTGSQEKGEMIFKVIGGDPSKGTLAVDTDFELQPGMTLQFMVPRTESEVYEDLKSKDSQELHKVLEFMCCKEDEYLVEQPVMSQRVLSSSGILIGVGPSSKTYLCQAPFSSLSLVLF
jgi:hypothetical protein